MLRSALATGLLPALLLVAAPMAAQSDADKMADASRAGPAELTSGATILDWPSGPDADFRVLRRGSNRWTCLPDNPSMANDEPMCLDGEWMNWLKAFATGSTPQTKTVGLSYMLNSTWSVSNTNPTADRPTSDNHWHSGGSHLMLIVGDPALLEGFPDEPKSAEPYVMWKGTPYAHVMIPVPEAHGGTTR